MRRKCYFMMLLVGILIGQQTTEAQNGQSSASKIQAALAAKSKADFVETPLSDVLDYLADRHNIPFFIDELALDDEGVSTDTPITDRGRVDTLSTLLDRILGGTGLTWLIRDEVLFVTTREKAEAMLDTHVFKIIKPMDADALIEDIASNIVPDAWDSVGGPSTICYLPEGRLIVSTIPKVDRQIKKHYSELLRQVDTSNVGVVEIPGRELPVQQLNATTTVAFIDTPLGDVAEFLSDLHGIKFRIDSNALNDVGLGKDIPITANLRGIRLSSALNLILEQTELVWNADKTGITFTTPEASEAKAFLAAYRATDLSADRRMLGLIEVVTTSIDPASWDQVGGTGAIRRGIRGTLDVRQRFGAHLQISKLLSDLRMAKKIMGR